MPMHDVAWALSPALLSGASLGATLSTWAPVRPRASLWSVERSLVSTPSQGWATRQVRISSSASCLANSMGVA